MKWLGVASFALLAGHSNACEFPEDALVSKLAGNDEAAIALVAPNPAPISRPFSIDVLLCAKSSNDTTLVDIDAVMPDHQHGMNYVPHVTKKTETAYQIEGMFFHMPGVWEIQAEIDVDGTKERPTWTVRAE